MSTAPSARSLKRALSSRYGVEKFTKRDGIVWRADGFPVVQSVLKPGSKGTATVSHFTITEKGASDYNFGLAFQAGASAYFVRPGKYVRLHIGALNCGNLMMSDTAMERRSNQEVREEAHGRVLIAGLGIGMILHPLLEAQRTRPPVHKWQQPLPAVEHVTVVELNQDVIDTVSNF